MDAATGGGGGCGWVQEVGGVGGPTPSPSQYSLTAMSGGGGEGIRVGDPFPHKPREGCVCFVWEGGPATDHLQLLLLYTYYYYIHIILLLDIILLYTSDLFGEKGVNFICRYIW